MSIVVVGSVALDSVETPFGKVDDALGGSATYFSLAARQFAEVDLVGVVGSDFPPANVDLLAERGVGLEGLRSEEGSTFRWAGRYHANMNECETLDTRLNVFATFQPKLPESYRDAGVVFLANIEPHLQLDVLRQVRRPWLTAMDTMNLWIEIAHDTVTEVMKSVDIVFVNETELRLYAGTENLVTAARHVLALGPKALIVKRGEYGSVLYAQDAGAREADAEGMDGAAAVSGRGVYFVAPAYPCEQVKDPTGAGDSFAGGFLGYIAREGNASPEALRRALVYGGVIGSFTVEDFGVRRLLALRADEIAQRYQEFREFTMF